MSDYILGIDVGTSSCKAAVFDVNGAVVDSRTQDYPIYYPQPGHVEQKPAEWWAHVCDAVRDILSAGKVRPSDIEAVGVSGQSWSAIVVDKAGEILFDDPIWMDTRASDICREVGASIGEKAIFDLCGNPFAPAYTTPKLIWFQRNYPDKFKTAYQILQSNSYMVYRLTGRFTQDISQGYGLHFFDMAKGQWDAEMASALGVDIRLMPEIFSCHEIVGTVTEEAAVLTGLLPGTPVVAGGLDAACGTLGVGAISNGQTQEQSGQAGGMSICLDTCKTHDKLIMSRHVVPDRWLLQGGTVSGGVLRWLREVIFPDLTFQDMDGLAATAPPGASGLWFLPYMAGERSPIWDKQAKGVYFGLDYAKTRPEIIRAAMESVAYASYHNIKTAEEAGAVIQTMIASGGAANSGIWMQIKADVTGKEICSARSESASALGAAMLAGMGTGMYRDCVDAVRQAVRIDKTYSPNGENHEKYVKFYGTYLRLYENLKDIMHEI